MHRTEGTYHASNLFTDGPPGTRVENDWLNAVQEELANVIEESGLALKTASTETRAQLYSALITLIGRGYPGSEIYLPYEPSDAELLERRLLEKNGASLLRADYSDLYAKIGVMYGAADGTHFYLPDGRGVFDRQWDNTKGVDPDAATRTDRGDGTGGDEVGTAQEDQNKPHTHTLSLYHAAEIFTPGAFSGILFDLAPNTQVESTAAVLISSGSDEARPINVNKWGGIFY